MSPESPLKTEAVILLLTQHQESLFRYIFSLVACEADARDILQETSLALSSTRNSKLCCAVTGRRGTFIWSSPISMLV